MGKYTATLIMEVELYCDDIFVGEDICKKILPNVLNFTYKGIAGNGSKFESKFTNLTFRHIGIVYEKEQT